MLIDIEEMIGEVLLLLDENDINIADRVEFGDSRADVRELIRGMLPAVAEEVVREAESREIDEWEEFDADVEWLSPGTGRVALPSGFLRLVVFRMSDWRRSVTRFIRAGSQEYALRFHPGRSRRGIRSSPAVAVVPGPGCHELEFTGSSDPGAYVERAGYLPVPGAVRSGYLLIPRSLLRKVTDSAAARVKSVLDL